MIQIYFMCGNLCVISPKNKEIYLCCKINSQSISFDKWTQVSFCLPPPTMWCHSIFPIGEHNITFWQEERRNRICRFSSLRQIGLELLSLHNSRKLMSLLMCVCVLSEHFCVLKRDEFLNVFWKKQKGLETCQSDTDTIS